MALMRQPGSSVRLDATSTRFQPAISLLLFETAILLSSVKQCGPRKADRKADRMTDRDASCPVRVDG